MHERRSRRGSVITNTKDSISNDTIRSATLSEATNHEQGDMRKLCGDRVVIVKI
jgi:hypothetical protein